MDCRYFTYSVRCSWVSRHRLVDEKESAFHTRVPTGYTRAVLVGGILRFGGTAGHIHGRSSGSEERGQQPMATSSQIDRFI